MICPKCGVAIDDNSKFCANCGAEVALDAQDMTPQDAIAETQPVPPMRAETDFSAPVAGQAPAQPFSSAQVPPQANSGNQYYAQPESQPTYQFQQPDGFSTPANPYAAPVAAPEGKEPLRSKTWFIVLLLLLFWPAGLVLMWMKTCKWPTVAKVLVTILFALYAIFAISTSVRSIAALNDQLSGNDLASVGTEQTETSSAVPTQSTDTTGTDTSDSNSDMNAGTGADATAGSGSATAKSGTEASSGSGGTESFDTWAEECLDSKNNPTVYSVLDLKGWQLETLAQQLGWQWDDSETAWVGPNGQGLAVVGADGTMNDEAIGELDKGGAGTPAMYLLVQDGYSTAEEALANTKVVNEDTYVLDDTGAMAAMYGPNMQRHLGILSITDGQASWLIFNEEAIAAGLLSGYLGDVSGTTVSEVWQEVVGSPLGEH